MNMEESTNGSLAAEFRHLVGDFFFSLTHPFHCVGRGCGRKQTNCFSYWSNCLLLYKRNCNHLSFLVLLFLKSLACFNLNAIAFVTDMGPEMQTRVFAAIQLMLQGGRKRSLEMLVWAFWRKVRRQESLE